MVYVDVLLVINFFMTLLLLLLTAALTKQPRRNGRLCIAAMLGAAYSLILLAPKLPTWVVVLSKIAVALVLVLAAFGFGSVKKYLRCLLCFLAANFVLLGFIVGVWLLFRPRRIVVKNSAVYFDLPARTLLLLALAAYVLALLILRLYEKHAGRRALLELTVDTGARQVRCFALADSGNRLREPFSGAPVIVARRSLFPDTETPRVIPYQTVGGEGMLTAFRPHRVTVHSGKRRGEAGLKFSNQAEGEITVMIKAVKEILQESKNAFLEDDANLAMDVEAMERVIDKLKHQLKKRHVDRLKKGECTIEHGFVMTDIITSLERISDHCSNIASCVEEIGHGSLDIHAYNRDIRRDETNEFRSIYEKYKEKYSLEKRII